MALVTRVGVLTVPFREQTLHLIKAIEDGLRSLDRAQLTSGLTPQADIIADRRHVCFVPKHKVAALQPAAREQEPRGRHPVERTAMAGWQGQHDQVMYCRRATHRTARIIWQAGTLMRRVTSTPP